MKRIGLTGGIGSGKSTVGKLLNIYGYPVYIADEASKRLTDESPIIKEKLNETFGENLYPDGKLDKRRLATLIFSDKQRLKQVNQIIHPEVNRDFQTWAKQQKASLCFLEAAILFEAGFDRYVDETVMVYAPIEVRIQRTMQRDNTSQEEVMKRIASQMSDEDKKKLANHLVINDDSHALIPQIEGLLKNLLKRY